jgi:myxalamid-type polyketide synthase MxaE and MxaD
LATAEMQMQNAHTGVSLLQPEHAVSVLSYLLGSTVVQTAVAKVDWTVLKVLYKARKERLFLEQIETHTQESADQSITAKQTNLLRQLEKVPAGDREDLLTGYLQSEVARIMGFESSQLPGLNEGFFEMGMDSQMVVELKYRLDASLLISLPLPVIFDHPTIKHLVDYIATYILQWESSIQVSEKIAENENNLQMKLSSIKQLPDEEIDYCIEKKLSKLECLVK